MSVDVFVSTWLPDNRQVHLREKAADFLSCCTLSGAYDEFVAKDDAFVETIKGGKDAATRLAAETLRDEFWLELAHAIDREIPRLSVKPLLKPFFNLLRREFAEHNAYDMLMNKAAEDRLSKVKYVVARRLAQQTTVSTLRRLLLVVTNPSTQI